LQATSMEETKIKGRKKAGDNVFPKSAHYKEEN